MRPCVYVYLYLRIYGYHVSMCICIYVSLNVHVSSNSMFCRCTRRRRNGSPQDGGQANDGGVGTGRRGGEAKEDTIWSSVRRGLCSVLVH